MTDHLGQAPMPKPRDRGFKKGQFRKFWTYGCSELRLCDFMQLLAKCEMWMNAMWKSWKNEICLHAKCGQVCCNPQAFCGRRAPSTGPKPSTETGIWDTPTAFCSSSASWPTRKTTHVAWWTWTVLGWDSTENTSSKVRTGQLRSHCSGCSNRGRQWHWHCHGRFESWSQQA